MPRPLVAITAALAAGIALSLWIDVSLTVTFFLLASTAGGCLLALLRPGDNWARRLSSGLLLATCLAAGIFWVALDRTTHQSRLLDDLHTHLYLTGTVAAEPQVFANRVVYTLDAMEVRQREWQEDLREKVQVVYYLPEKAGQRAGAGSSPPGAADPSFPLFAYGDVLQVFGQLEQPSVPRNSGEFDYRTYLARQGIFTHMTVDDAQDITRLASGWGHPLVAIALAAKGRAVVAIEASLPYPEAGLLQAIIFGDTEKLEENEVGIFQDLGVYHLFAVSGYNVGFLLVIILALARILGLSRWSRLVVGSVLILFHAAVTGFTPSVSRASLMAGTVLLGQALGEKVDFYTDLALAALIILLASPQQLFLPGFQMSFLATWGIVYLYPLLHGLLGLSPNMAGGKPGPGSFPAETAAGLDPASTGGIAASTRGATDAAAGAPVALTNRVPTTGTSPAAAPAGTLAPTDPPAPQAMDKPEPLRGWLQEKAAALGRGLRESVAVSLAAQLAVLPLSAAYFNLVSPGALLANLVVVPVAGLAVILGLIVLLAAQIAIPVASLLASAAGGLLWGILLFLQFLARFPGMAVNVPAPKPWAIALFLGCLVAVREIWMRRDNLALRARVRNLLPISGAVAAVLLVTYLLLPHPPGELKVVFVDVGQGSSVYLEMPNGKDMLVDGGGLAMPLPGSDFNVGKDIVVPFLIRQGVRQMDLLVSTHPDADHIQGLETVLTSLPVSLAVLPPPAWFGPGYDNFLSLAGYRETATTAAATADRPGLPPTGGLGSSEAPPRLSGLFSSPSQVPVAPVTRGYRLQLDPGVEIEVLHPQYSYTGTRSNDNNASLVLRVTYGQISFLLTGDVEEEGIQELLAEKMPLSSTVLLLPHHGSRYSFVPEFYQAVNPAAVVVQAGEHNTFGHPAPEIVTYWTEHGVPLYRTDRQGAITWTTDGKNLQVETMIPSGPEK